MALQFGLSLAQSPQPVHATWGWRIYLPNDPSALQPALLDRSGHVEFVMLGIVEEPKQVESLHRAVQVGQTALPALGDAFQFDPLAGAQEHAVLDPADVDLRIVGAEVYPFDG